MGEGRGGIRETTKEFAPGPLYNSPKLSYKVLIIFVIVFYPLSICFECNLNLCRWRDLEREATRSPPSMPSFLNASGNT